MGLDNGIMIKRFKKNRLNEIPKFVDYEIYYNRDDTVDVELAYWRKCWNVRDAIINAINPEYDPAGYADCKIDVDNISALIGGLMPLFDKDKWTDGAGGSIWTFEEQFDNMVQVVLNLKWLETYLKENDDIEVVFYDSF